MPMPAHLMNRRSVSVEVGLLEEDTKAIEPGEIVTYERIEKVTGLHRLTPEGKPGPGWMSLIKQWRKRLEARVLYLAPRAIAGVGYQVMTGQHKVSASLRSEKKKDKINRQEATWLGTLDHEQLDEADRQVAIGLTTHVVQAGELFTRQKKELRLWLTKKETLPRIASDTRPE